MVNYFRSKEEFVSAFKNYTENRFGRPFEETHPEQRYQALGILLVNYVNQLWAISKRAVREQQAKQLYYFSMEFLMGRLLANNLINLGIYPVVEEGLKELGMDLGELEEMEADAGLGNGGLGRLAACFLDSLASLNLVGNGNCIRYQFGLFKQEIQNYEQVEKPDYWLKNGDIWEVWKPHDAVQVKFGGTTEVWMEHGKLRFKRIPDFVVRAVPYDMPIVGYDTPCTNTLRLWDAQVDEDSVPAGKLTSYLADVNALTANVYPNDSTEKGKELRLKQEYFFVCAGIDQIVKYHLQHYPSLDNLADKAAIQLNDTHPALVVPELMRVLVDKYNYEWDDAWRIVQGTVAYTNHTILSEALEKWPQAMVKKLLPRIYMIIEEIERRFRAEVDYKGRSNDFYEMSILKEDQVYMANLAVIGSHSVNGVAQIHTDILVNNVMATFASFYPGKFNNKTNGVTHRRWLVYSNPQLTRLLLDTIGDEFIKNPAGLEKLMDYVDDEQVQNWFLDVKRQRKQILADYVKKTQGIEVDVNSIFDCQSKRLHAYKRQLLNIFHVMYLYLRMKQDPGFRIHPKTVFFSAKAAPSYALAKEIIKLINRVADKINNDPEINGLLKVVFIPNYSVSIAQMMVTAADISEQISTAGKEASGTGNMKYMMNGALTVGTLDGANVEIVNQVGYENSKIFGLRVEDIDRMKKDNSYNSWEIYNHNNKVRMVIDSLRNGTWSDNPNEFNLIYTDLMVHRDEFFVLADFDAYLAVCREASNWYQNKPAWARAMLINIAKSGYFSSDRTIQQYADEIWGLQPLHFSEKDLEDYHHNSRFFLDRKEGAKSDHEKTETFFGNYS